jgi:hypothetical protein
MRIVILIFVLMFAIPHHDFAQRSQSLGIIFKSGTPYSSLSNADGGESSLVRRVGVNFISPGLFFQYRTKDWSFSLSGLYQWQKYGYKDTQVLNGVSGSSFEVNTKINSFTIELGLQKAFETHLPAHPFIGAYLTSNMMNTNALVDTKVEHVGTSENLYSIVNFFPKNFSLGIRPEIGFTLVSKRGREFSFSLTHHFGFQRMLSGHYMVIDNQSNLVSNDEYTAHGDYSSLVLRYPFTLKSLSTEDIRKMREAKGKALAEKPTVKKERHAVEKVPVEKPVKKDKEPRVAKTEKPKHEHVKHEQLTTYRKGKPIKHLGRKVEIQKEITVPWQTLELFLWDSGAKEDGDTISVYVNDELVLSNHHLRKERDSITIVIRTDRPNYVIIHAHNEGTIPPNTASISYVMRSGRENTFRIYSRLDLSGAIKINYKP